MTDRQAKYLLAIAEEGSISKAAKKLYVSQPSLSQMLLSVEKQYGLKLFKRDASAMTLTYAGEKYMEGVREIMQIQRRMEQQMQEIAESYAGKLTLGITASKGHYMLPAILPEFQAQFPKIELNIVEGTNQTLENHLLARRIDLAVINYTSYHKQLAYVQLPSEEMLLILSQNHRLAAQCRLDIKEVARPSLSLHQISMEPFIYLAPHHGVRTMVDSIFTSIGICPPKVLESGNNATAHALVAVGMGITILPDNFVRYVAAERNCLYFSISDARYYRKVAIAYPKSNNISRSMSYLIDLTAKKMHDLYETSNQRL